MTDVMVNTGGLQ